MTIEAQVCKDYSKFDHQIVLIDKDTALGSLTLSKEDSSAIKEFFDKKIGSTYHKTADGKTLSVVKIDTSKESFKISEASKASNARSRLDPNTSLQKVNQ